MKWGRRQKPNNPSAAPPRRSLLASWLLRFKKMGIGSSKNGSGTGDFVDTKPRKVNPSGGWNRSSERFSGSAGAEFYRGHGAFWRLSFRKEKVDGGLGELLGDTVDEQGEVKNFDQMVSGVRKIRGEVQRTEGSLMELKTPRRRKLTRQRSRSRGKVGAENSGSSPVESQDCDSSVAGFKEIDELAPELVSDEEPSAELRSEDLKSRRQRKSLHVSGGSPTRRARQSCRVRIHSLRSRSGTEMRGGEQTKRAKLKSKKKSKEKGIAFERFAMVKCSFDPQRDFRDSMIEMILEIKIRKTEELEELLACYLSLNTDEYHDLIIEVFRQIWFELSQASCCEYDPSELPTEEDW
ncbi:transcription repressor OFP5 [Punica granatum]|uniref:Transcription repressor n=2 Tax=Punica granatum TaxID=22663 RepID=A0A218VYA8_PUNGR|nr:transcription repressor OFP5 [Punica granatum]OWM65534.1 hypothetical protein CDL15_Pgr023804 [Punica granatum]PKI74781.1 hypothetical protein CRG98_004799 [Punica granatum]